MAKHSSLASIIFLLSGCLSLFAAETIAVDRRSALSALAVELDGRYGYFVTYEEGPFGPTELHEETLANSKRYLSPVWKPIEFRLPDALPAATDSTVGSEFAKSIPPLGPGILEPLVQQYNESGNPGKFFVIYEGKYAHIVQVTHLVDGATEKFEPILSTKVTFTPESRTCSQVLDDLFGQIGKLRHTGIVNVNIGITGLWARECTVLGDNLTAREALEQILDQLGMSLTPAFPSDHFAWSLMYDASWREYFLSIRAVRDMTPHTMKAPPLATGTPPATATSPTGSFRAARPTPIKKN